MSKSPHNFKNHDIHKTLELFENEHVLDYCEEFDCIKAVLEYFDKNVKKLEKICFKGGNEKYINDLETKLQNVFIQHSLMVIENHEFIPVKAAIPKLRKIAMFLFMNCDASYKFNLKDNSHISHVFEICPLMSKFLLMTLIWDFGLNRYLFEILSYMPFWFSFLHFENAIETIKYESDPRKFLKKVEGLCKAILINQARSDQRYIEPVEKKIIFGKLYDHLTNLLRIFHTPDAARLEKIKRPNRKIYSGVVMKSILEMTSFQFDLIEDLSKAEPEEKLEIYEDFDIFTKKVENPTLTTSNELAEQQYKCLMALLNALESHSFSISIDTFLCWTEEGIDGGKITLQNENGIIAYHVYEKIEKNKIEHAVVSQLIHFMVTPKSLQETIQESTTGDKLRALDDEIPIEDKRAWLNSILEDSCSLGNEECLEAIKAQVSIFGVDQLTKIMDYIKLKRDHIKFLEKGGEDKECGDFDTVCEEIVTAKEQIEELVQIVILALFYLEEEQLIDSLGYQIEKFGTTTEPFRSNDFETKSNEFFNKLANDFDTKRFYVICFEAPFRMLAKFFKIACTHESGTIEYIKVLKQTQKYNINIVNEILNRACEDSETLKELYFPNFLANIYTMYYFPTNYSDFLKRYICDKVITFLDDEEFDYVYQLILACLKITSSSLATETCIFGDKTAPILLVVAKVLEVARWDMRSFTETRCRLVNECITLILKINARFSLKAAKRDRLWIMRCIASYNPSTKFYFQRYNLQVDEPIVEFTKFLGVDKSDEFLPFLIHNFSRSTCKEAKYLATNDVLKPYIPEVMQMYGEFVHQNRSVGSLNCYRHCLANFIEIVKTILMEEITIDYKKAEEFLVKFLRILASAPKDIYEQCFLNAESILSDLLEELETPLVSATIDNINKHIELLHECKTKEILIEKFKKLPKGSSL